MSGYVAMARIEGGRVRALAWDGSDPGRDLDDDDARPVRDLAWPDGCPTPTLRDRWRWACDELGMMTFFLLDPESWR